MCIWRVPLPESGAATDVDDAPVGAVATLVAPDDAAGPGGEVAPEPAAPAEVAPAEVALAEAGPCDEPAAEPEPEPEPVDADAASMEVGSAQVEPPEVGSPEVEVSEVEVSEPGDVGVELPEAESPEPGSPGADEPEPPMSEAPGIVPDTEPTGPASPEPDEPATPMSGAEDPDAAEAPGAPEAAAGLVPVPPAPSTVRRRSRLRRGMAVGVLAAGAALAVSAFASVGARAGDVDRRFVDSLHAQGYVADPHRQALLVSAAHKLCERRVNHRTLADRKATALSTQEVGTVTTTFAGDTRTFTALALQTFCSS